MNNLKNATTKRLYAMIHDTQTSETLRQHCYTELQARFRSVHKLPRALPGAPVSACIPVVARYG